MRFLLTSFVFLVLAGATMAFDLGHQAPAKPADNSVYFPPDEVRQGGDTVATAVPITYPGSYTGTTAGYVDDYDEACPYAGTAPDVVYAITPATDVTLSFDLCFSSYDTKIFIYREDMTLVACNDDFYFSPPCYEFSSKLEFVALLGGATYFVVIDGYGSYSGSYQLDVVEYVPCELTCPVGAQLENEPALVDGYVDSYNSGCGNLGVPVFQPITALVFCGTAGWYLGDGGAEYRDTDWFQVTIPSTGTLEVVGDAEYATYMFELAPPDCDTVDVAQMATIGPCQENTLSVTGEPGSLVWLWVGSTTFSGPVNEYVYVLSLNLDGPVATETETWSGVKALFR